MMTRAILASVAAAAAVGAVVMAGGVAQAPPGFDGNRAYEHLRQIVAFGPRPAGSPALASTREYIRKQLADIGIQTIEQAFDAETPVGRIHMVNLIARIPGASAERIVFAGHYDTKLFREIPLRRRKRCRVQHGVPHRMGPCDEGAKEPVHRRTAVP